VNRAPRVLLVNYEFPPLGGGAGTATAGLARALVALGTDVVVLTSRFRGQPDAERMDGYTVQRVPVLRRRADRCTPAEMLTFVASASIGALRLARRWRPDLTIAFFGVPGGPVAWLLQKRHRVPYIVSLRGGDVPGFDHEPGAVRMQHLFAPAIRFVWRGAVAVIANGQGLKQLAEAAMPGLHVPVVPNGVDAQLHAPPAHGRSVPVPGPVRVLLVGRLVHQKGCDLLIRALSTLRHLPFTLQIVGDGPDRAALAAQAAKAGISDRIDFEGWVARERIGDYYRSADVFVLPSRIEGMPNVVLEAMAHALPVVGTDVPGNRDLIDDERTGLLVPAENPAALAAALERVMLDGTLRERLGNAARDRIVTHHSWHASAAAYLQLGGLSLSAASPVGRPALVVH
jgi:glycosyltransferase involved in cell wall biosynthesis